MFDEYKLKSAGVNVEDAINRFAGKASLFDKYINKFPSDASFASILPALEAKNYSAARNYIHTLKGLAGNFSMNDLYSACVELLDAIKQERYKEVENLYCSVSVLYKKVVDAIIQP